MIANAAEIRAALHGLFRLARFDRGGLAYFDRTDDGFWRSFTAYLLAYPGYMWIAVMQTRGDGPSSARVIAETLGYVVVATLFPLVATWLTRLLDRRERLFDYLVPYNWSILIQVYVALIWFGFVMPDPEAGPRMLALVANLVLMSGLMLFQGVIARLALEIQPGQAAAIVLIDGLLSIIVQSWADRIS
jgi:hypothetical protein